MPDVRRPWWSLESIRTWDRSGFKPWEEWPLGWRRPLGILGIVWLLTVIAIVVTSWISMDERSWLSDLLIIGVLQYLVVGMIHMGAIVADRDIQWDIPLKRLRWISFGVAAALWLIVLIRA